MASLAVRFKRCSKGTAIDGAFNCCHAACRKLRADILWQDKKRPNAAYRWPHEFCFETKHRSGFGHIHAPHCNRWAGRTSRANRMPPLLRCSYLAARRVAGPERNISEANFSFRHHWVSISAWGQRLAVFVQPLLLALAAHMALRPLSRCRSRLSWLTVGPIFPSR